MDVSLECGGGPHFSTSLSSLQALYRDLRLKGQNGGGEEWGKDHIPPPPDNSCGWGQERVP